MHSCPGCGVETSRSRTTFPNGWKAGQPVGGCCPTCRPEEFSAPFDPLDRLVPEHEALPHLYKRGSDGVYRPKDEHSADIDARLSSPGPTLAAEQRKRATRRTTPMSQTEIQEAEQAWRQRAN